MLSTDIYSILEFTGITAAYRKGFKLKMEVKDSNGNLLKDGDSVILIKSLPVKGTSITLKKGMVIKNIRLTEDDGEVDCKADKMRIVLKTEFLKKG